ncbi:MAG: hypothetical protein IID15_07965 [Candidatus Marinimicrobia bacterium]|nr:hypothetical protein [Candidatus Neomarinimicrobiota bacterium]
MQRAKAISRFLLALLAAWGCGFNDPVVVEVQTSDINDAPYYFSFSSGSAVDNLPDVTFDIKDNFYSVALNSEAGVGAIVDSSGNFAAGVAAASGMVQYDGASRIIGAKWIDADSSAFDPDDNNSFTSNGIYYYLRLGAYDVVKFQVTKASEIAFNIEYAVQLNDSTAGSPVTQTVPYSKTVPTPFDFTTGAPLDSVDWNMGLVLAPVYVDSSDEIAPAPAVIFNFANGTRVGVLTNDDFDTLESVPANITWQTEGADNRPFGYLGTYEVLVYHPDLQKVLVENPGYVYIIDDGTGAYYKLRFRDWSSGLILFEYGAL